MAFCRQFTNRILWIISHWHLGISYFPFTITLRQNAPRRGEATAAKRRERRYKNSYVTCPDELKTNGKTDAIGGGATVNSIGDSWITAPVTILNTGHHTWFSRYNLKGITRFSTARKGIPTKWFNWKYASCTVPVTICKPVYHSWFLKVQLEKLPKNPKSKTSQCRGMWHNGRFYMAFCRQFTNRIL